MTEVSCFVCDKAFINTSETGEVMHFEGYSRLASDIILVSLPMCKECISKAFRLHRNREENE